jgi:XTP/dITP diphosphohydrolase
VPARIANATLCLATSNRGKLDEVRALAEASPFHIAALPEISSLAPFKEIHPTFAENAAGKALHFSRYAGEMVLADDSGLVVPALGGAPGVRSARYAGPAATDADRVARLLDAMRGRSGDERKAHFVCVIAVAQRGVARAIVSAQADGMLLDQPQGAGGFGYDPIFFFPSLGKTFAEMSREEKNLYSHRGIAFRKAIEFLASELAAAAPDAFEAQREETNQDDDGVWYSPRPK